MKKTIFLCKVCLLTLIVATCLTGCKKKEIFIDKDKEYNLVSLSDSEIESDIFYAKDGARFYATYLPEGNAKKEVSKEDPSRVLWTKQDETLIPSIYRDGAIAYASKKKSDMESVTIERFYDLGQTFGLYGGTLDENGEYNVNVKTGVVPDSSAAEAFGGKKSESNKIRIATINDNPVKDYFRDGGVLYGLDENTTYSIGYYQGTYYDTVQVTTDTHMYQSYEFYTLEDITATKNGYLCINMPKDAKSGFYTVNGMGMFKYYAYSKGAEDDTETDMNEKYYTTTLSGVSTDTQIYTVSVKEATTNVGFTVTFEENDIAAEDISCKLMSPSGNEYEMELLEDGSCYTELAEVIAGKWSIYINPKELIVKDINVKETAPETDTTQETYDFDVAEEGVGRQFYVTYTGEGQVWGVVTDENGNSQQLETIKTDSKTEYKMLGTTYAYLAPGHYKMTVYHYADTRMLENGIQLDSNEITEDIIQFEQ